MRSREGQAEVATKPDAKDRVDWVDYAKGWCIILVVMMHSTLGVEEAMGRESWLNDFVDWARPFRMPDFFLVAGLFLSRTIDKPWGRYLDRKVLHFLYFFVLWTLIQGVPKLFFAVGPDPSAILQGLAFAMVEPFGTLWFIYLLPVFFLTTRLLRHIPIDIVLAGAAVMQMLQISTDWTIVDEFAGRYVYFFAGYAYAPQILGFAEQVRGAPARVVGALLVWGAVNAIAVSYGFAPLPGVSLILGFAGAAAVVAFSALLAETRTLPALASLGSRSLIVYLAFFLPMAGTRILLVKSGLINDSGVVALTVTAVAVLFPLILDRLVRGTRLAFLFKRPQILRLERAERAPELPASSPKPRASRAPRRAPPQAPTNWRLSA